MPYIRENDRLCCANKHPQLRAKRDIVEDELCNAEDFEGINGYADPMAMQIPGPCTACGEPVIEVRNMTMRPVCVLRESGEYEFCYPA